MPKGQYAIFTQNVSSTVSTVSFNNIPQTYTDLKIVFSGRSSNSNATYYDAAIFLTFNNDTSANYGSVRMYSVGSGTGGSDRRTSQTNATLGLLTATETLSNVFSNVEAHIPNYTSTLYKSFVSDSVNENNTTAAVMQITGSSWRANTPITSIQISGTWVSGSSITLYGISR